MCLNLQARPIQVSNMSPNFDMPLNGDMFISGQDG